MIFCLFLCYFIVFFYDRNCFLSYYFSLWGSWMFSFFSKNVLYKYKYLVFLVQKSSCNMSFPFIVNNHQMITESGIWSAACVAFCRLHRHRASIPSSVRHKRSPTSIRVWANSQWKQTLTLSRLPLQSYADGSQYMASHDSLSPPYTNSRLTGTVPLRTSLSLLCCECLQRIRDRQVDTVGDMSSAMWLPSLSLACCMDKRQGSVCSVTHDALCLWLSSMWLQLWANGHWHR